MPLSRATASVYHPQQPCLIARRTEESVQHYARMPPGGVMINSQLHDPESFINKQYNFNNATAAPGRKSRSASIESATTDGM